MTVPREKLGLPGGGAADILELKCDPILAGTMSGEEGVLPAYHMHRPSWITLLLDGTVDRKRLCFLLDRSFELTAPRGSIKRGPRSWLIPANPAYFDIEQDLAENNDTMLWKQSSSVAVGDTVYIYVAAPVSAIRYQCSVLEADIPYNFTSGRGAHEPRHAPQARAPISRGLARARGAALARGIFRARAALCAGIAARGDLRREPPQPAEIARKALAEPLPAGEIRAAQPGAAFRRGKAELYPLHLPAAHAHGRYERRGQPPAQAGDRVRFYELVYLAAELPVRRSGALLRRSARSRSSASFSEYRPRRRRYCSREITPSFQSI